MTTELEVWLEQATRCLAADSNAQVRREISEHYESARDAALARGNTAEQAGRAAIDALGSSRAANRQYRKVLLTSSEAQMLREARWESRAVRCRPLLARTFRLLPMALAGAASMAFAEGHSAAARIFVAAALVAGIAFAVPTFPIYTPSRGRIYRIAKWIGLSVALSLAAGSQFLAWSGAILSLGSYLVWLEFARSSIRRKLPVSEWPKTLYL